MIVTLAEMLPVAFVQRAGLAIRCADISNLLLGIVDIARRNATSTSRQVISRLNPKKAISSAIQPATVEPRIAR